MSRGRSERKPDRNHEELDFFGRRDPFAEMHQVMKSFGGFGFGGRDDFFGGSLMKPFGDPFEEMMQFSNAHKNLHSSGKDGGYVCQTYVSSSTMGPDGKMKQESYFENSAGQNKNGQTISQKQQAYKNNDGVKRMAEERMLNDKGHKIMKEKKGNGEIEHSNHYYNLDEGESERFRQDWQAVNNQTKFLENAQKHMPGLGYGSYGNNSQQRQLGYEPRRDEPQRRREEPRRQERQEEPRGHETKQSGFKGEPSVRGQVNSRGAPSQHGSTYKGSSRGSQF